MEISQSLLIFTYLSTASIFLLSLSKHPQEKNNFFLGILIVFPLLYGLRSFNVGVDSNVYMQNFLNQSHTMEAVVNSISKTVKLFTDNYHIFFLVISVSYFVALKSSYTIVFGNGFLSNSAVFLHYIFPYAIQMNINIMRQGLSLAFFLFALSIFYSSTMEKKSKAILSVSFVILSSLTHKSSAVLFVGILLLTYIIRKIKLNKIPYLFLAFIIFSYSPLIDLILNFMKNFSSIQFITKIINYSYGRPLSLFPKQFVYVAIIFFLIRSLKDLPENFNQLLNRYPYHAMSVVVSLLAVFSSFSYHASTRFMLFNDFLIPIMLINYVYELPEEKQKKTAIIGLSLMFLVLITLILFTTFFSRSFNW